MGDADGLIDFAGEVADQAAVEGVTEIDEAVSGDEDRGVGGLDGEGLGAGGNVGEVGGFGLDGGEAANVVGKEIAELHGFGEFLFGLAE